MHINVQFTTQVKAALGRSEQSVQLEDGATVMDAIRQLAQEHGEAFAKFVFVQDQLLPSILTTVNDQQVSTDEALRDGDQLILLSAISGG